MRRNRKRINLLKTDQKYKQHEKARNNTAITRKTKLEFFEGHCLDSGRPLVKNRNPSLIHLWIFKNK